MKKITLFNLLIFSTLTGFSQQATQIDPKFITMSRFTDLAAIQATITSPVNGMMVYNNGTQSFWYYNGAWNNLTAAISGSQWATSGANISNNNGGNVGIGTITPTSKLNVNGQVTIDQKNFGGYGGLLIKGNKVGFNYPNIVFSVNNNAGQDINTAYIGGDIESNTTGSEAMGISFLTATGPGNNFVERMKIKSNGNVGIGTTNPTTAKLVIGGNVGQEGIDLSTNDIYANMRVIRNSNFGTDKDMFLGYGSGATSSLHLYSNNIETMTVRNNFVGIGNNNPTEKLSVNGNVQIEGGGKLFVKNPSSGGIGSIGYGGGFLTVGSDNIVDGQGVWLNPVNAFTGTKFKNNGEILLSENSGGINHVLASGGAGSAATWKAASQIIQNFSVGSPDFIIPDNQTNNIPGSSITFTAATSGRIIIFPRVETKYGCFNPLDHCHLSWDFTPKLNGTAIFTNNQFGVSRYQQVLAYVAPSEDRSLGPYVVSVSAGTHTVSFDIKLNTITPAPTIRLNAYVQFIPN